LQAIESSLRDLCIKMKIAFQSYAFHPAVGGIESSAQIFIREFINAGHEIRVHTLTSLGTQQEINTAPVYRNPSLPQLLNDFKWADVIYQHNPSLRLSWPAIASSTPQVISIRTWMQRSEDNRISLVDRLKRYYVSRQTVISNSQATADDLDFFSTVIQNAYDDRIFNNTTESDARDGLVFVGRLVKDKGCDVLIDALAQLNASNIRHHLTIIGGGPEEAALKQQAANLGLTEQIKFLGQQSPSTVAQILNQSKYHIIPSRWAEPFGIVALEGIACGVIPIGTDQGGLVDAIGKCGPLFPANDFSALAALIEELDQTPPLYRQYLDEQQHHLIQHSPKTVAQRYLEIFEKASQR